MPTQKNVELPDIGDFDAVDIIEVLVKVGDTVHENDSIITLETDKATMEIPAPFAGKVTALSVKVGDKVAKGDLILTLESESESAESLEETTESAQPVVLSPAEYGHASIATGVCLSLALATGASRPVSCLSHCV